MDSVFARRRKQIESALLDYQRTPGKYPLLLRRPEILFSSIREVLQLASGRLPNDAEPPGLAVRRAAGFFVRNALLYPAADHYALLGLDRGADTAAIKERYRQMMRLTHPDFAGSPAAGGDWPADAASRINQAYEVLASPVQRRGYDEKLSPGAAPAPQRARSHSVVQAKAAAKAAAPDPRRLLKRMAGAFGVLGAIALAASLAALGPDRESLVQRAATPLPSPEQSVVAQADPKPMRVEPRIEQPAPASHARVHSESTADAPHVTPAVPLVLPKAEAAAAPVPAPARMVAVSVEAPAASRAMPQAATNLPALLPAPLPATSTASFTVAPAPIAAPLPAATPAPALAAAPVDPPPPVMVARASQPAKPKPIVVPAVTMAEAHSLLAALLQQMESGSADRLLSGLERSVRSAPSAQALARQYGSLVEGSRSVKVSNLLLKGAGREDRLLVRGQVMLEIGGETATRARELMLEAEFAKRDGVVLMTRLAPVPVMGAAAQ